MFEPHSVDRRLEAATEKYQPKIPPSGSANVFYDTAPFRYDIWAFATLASPIIYRKALAGYELASLAHAPQQRPVRPTSYET